PPASPVRPSPRLHRTSRLDTAVTLDFSRRAPAAPTSPRRPDSAHLDAPAQGATCHPDLPVPPVPYRPKAHPTSLPRPVLARPTQPACDFPSHALPRASPVRPNPSRHVRPPRVSPRPADKTVRACPGRALPHLTDPA